MRRLNKNVNDPDEPSKQSDPDAPPTLPRDPDKRPGYGPMRVMGVLVVCLMATSVVFSLSVVLRDPPTNGVPAEGRRVHEVTAPEGTDFMVVLLSIGSGVSGSLSISICVHSSLLLLLVGR